MNIRKSAATLCIMILLCLVVGINGLRAIVFPRAESTAYISLLPNMPDDELKMKYDQDFHLLQNLPSDYPTASMLNADEQQILQLPIFKIPIFRAMLNELKRRGLIDKEEFNKGEMLANEKERLLNITGRISPRFLKLARHPYLSLEFYKDSLAKMSKEELVGQIKRLELMPKHYEDRTNMINLTKEELSKRTNTEAIK